MSTISTAEEALKALEQLFGFYTNMIVAGVVVFIVLIIALAYLTSRRQVHTQKGIAEPFPGKAVSTIYCRYCGAKNKEDAVFCQKCGKPLK